MNFRLIDSGWDKVMDDALRAHHADFRIVCPFIKKRPAEHLLTLGKFKAIQVITRFSLRDFAEGVSDISALRLLLESGAQIRGIRNLHAKLYLFGNGRVIVTSANLTDAALLRNHEFGFVAGEVGIIDRCRQYFDHLWSLAGKDLPIERLLDWERKVTKHLANGARSAAMTGLADEGVDVGFPPGPVMLPPRVSDAQQWFVKFFGEGYNRADRSMQILDEVRRSGSHWACTYPKGKRPRKAQDGAVMFMGRMVKEPNDILIYGRAFGMRHVQGRDDATAKDIQLRDWKAKWPHYVRVDSAEFVHGTLANGVSLNELMDTLKADAFTSTQRHARRGVGNNDPRRAYMQQPAVELSAQGSAWLDERLEHSFAKHGKLTPATLEHLDWPAIPFQAGNVGR